MKKDFDEMEIVRKLCDIVKNADETEKAYLLGLVEGLSRGGKHEEKKGERK